jgi:hypothetical protein
MDEQAVEVARFSLLLKLIERETADSIKAYMLSHRTPALPSLDGNIRHGNSLVTSKTLQDVYPKSAGALVPKVFPFDWINAFPFLIERGGFSAIIGNPPYIRIQHMVGYPFADNLRLLEHFRHFPSKPRKQVKGGQRTCIC